MTVLVFRFSVAGYLVSTTLLNRNTNFLRVAGKEKKMVPRGPELSRTDAANLREGGGPP